MKNVNNILPGHWSEFASQSYNACVLYFVLYYTIIHTCLLTFVACVFSGAMDELQSLDPRRQELLEARFMGGISGSTGSTGSTSGGTKVSGRIILLSVSFFYVS